MKYPHILVVLLLSIVFSIDISAQKAVKKQGDLYFEAGKYREALEAYQKYNKTNSEAELLIKRGICYLYTNQPDACISDMATAHQLKSKDFSLFKYSGMAYFIKQDYIEAAKFYKTYLSHLKVDTPEWKNIVNEIKRCGYAKNQKYAPQLAFVENLGQNVNTIYDDFAPIQSPTLQGRYYFSSSRDGTTGGMRNESGLTDEVSGIFSSDMFLVDLKDGNWSSVLPFEQLLNTPKNDILQDFSPDGSIIYFVKSPDLKTGTLYTDTFNLDRDPSKLPVAADIPFKAEAGDKDLFIFNDSLILFASLRPEGFGGYDLYYANKQNNLWQNPINLGKDINSSANDTGPFLVKNGLKLYFSSDRMETLGGYDIFMADLSSHMVNPVITNLGLPINSTKDDLDFELSADGMNALFSSDRIESIGGLDLYVAYFKAQVLDQLAFVDIPAFVTSFNNEEENPETSPVKAIISSLPPRDFVSKPLYFKENEDILNPSNLNLVNKLLELLVIYPDLNVLLVSHFISEGRPDFDLYFSIKRAEKVAERLIAGGISPHRILMQGGGANFPLAKPLINSIPSTLADKTNRRIDVIVLASPELNLKVTQDEPAVAQQFRDTLWDKFNQLNKGVTFRVRFSKVSQMLKSDVFGLRNDAIVEKKASDDQYTYTMGNYSVYNEARLLKGALIRYGMPDAVIIPYYKGIMLEPAKIKSLSAAFPELETYLKFE
ncbi:MAG: PD40 domain-containing protein [Saprospiraceae bacterium]|nr:PD40 domain-containing protein [Saprospiraceae bacterium]